MKTNDTPPSAHRVVPADEWLAARQSLLAREKELTRLRDEITAQRQALPWTKVTKPYRFEGPSGKVTLGQLFDGRSQLVVYHFMLGPGWEEGCKSCSFVSDHFDAMLPHLAARDVTLTAVSHAPWREIEPFRRRLGWRFPWVSSHGSDFNRDYQASFDPKEVGAGPVYYNYTLRPFPVEEAPGFSVFATDGAGEVCHTYSTYGRGIDWLMGTYHVLDLVPKGRDEAGFENPMTWVRHHDRYAPAAARA